MAGHTGILMNRFGRAKTVTDEALSGVPAAVGIEDDEEEIAAVLRDLGDQTPAGLGSKARLHAFDAGNVTEEPIRRVQHIGTVPGNRRDDFPFFSHEFSKDRILQGHFTEFGQVLSR